MSGVRDWVLSARAYCTAPCLRMFLLGFSSGLPLLLVLGTLGFRLREAQVGLATIGFMSWVGLVYAMKWAWAPMIDHVRIPVLSAVFGRRRAWLLVAQAGLMASLASMAWIDPARQVPVMVGAALVTAFFSATQDIALDAYRIESADVESQGLLAACYQFGYRIAMIWAGAGALAVAAGVAGVNATGYNHHAWSVAYLAMAASVLVGVGAVLFSPEDRSPVRTVVPARPRQGLREKIEMLFWRPLVDFYRRYGRQALVLLALVSVYRISDVVMGIMANPFYADMGFTKAEVALVTKVFGVIMTLAGTFIGGLVVLRLGVMKAMMLGAVLSAATNILFSLLAGIGHSVAFLTLTVSADNLAGGLASSAFVAFLSGMTNREFSATQYALLSSVMLLLPKLLAGFSGTAVESVGYSAFFIGTALIGLPVVALVWIAAKGESKQ